MTAPGAPEPVQTPVGLTDGPERRWGRGSSPRGWLMPELLTYDELTRQTTVMKNLLDISAALGRGDVDQVGRLLGAAIDNYPELEGGLLNSVATALRWGVEAGRLSAGPALGLADDASRRLATMMTAEVAHG